MEEMGLSLITARRRLRGKFPGEDRSQQGELSRITVESMEDGVEENCQG